LDQECRKNIELTILLFRGECSVKKTFSPKKLNNVYNIGFFKKSGVFPPRIVKKSPKIVEKIAENC
jgi:hypothetical protein